MADAWSTVVHREPEWDETNRTLAIAGVIADEARCPRCGNVESVVEVTGAAKSGWVWPPRDRKDPDSGGPLRPGETAYRITQYRCVACAGAAVRERDLNRRAEKAGEPPEGQMADTDATWFRVTPHHAPRPQPQQAAGRDTSTTQTAPA